MRTHGRAWITEHSLASYFLLTFGLTWILALPMIAVAQGWSALPIPFLLHYLTAYAPLTGAFIITALTTGKLGLHELWDRMSRWRVSLHWWLIAVLSPLALFLLAALGVQAVGGAWPDLGLLGQINYLPNLGVGAWLFWILTSGFGEETGWRGFALPRLQQRSGALVASLLLGVVWALWHLPFFFYLRTYMAMGITMFPFFALGVITGAIIYTWLYNGTRGSVLMVALFHGSFNYVTASKASDGMIAAIISIAFIIWAILLVVIYKPATLSSHEKSVLAVQPTGISDQAVPATPRNAGRMGTFHR